MPNTHFVAYVNNDGIGIAFADASLRVLVTQMKKSPGFYLVKRGSRDVGIYTRQMGFQAL